MAPAEKKEGSALPPNVLRMRCSKCGAILKVPMKVAGRYIDCPKCTKRVPVPATQEEADNEAQEYTVNVMAYEIPETCTKCGKKMRKNTVLCVHCGFDYKRGKQLETEDLIVKPGEKRRGGPALLAMIIEVMLSLILFGVFAFRVTMDEKIWWELGLYLAFGLAFIAMAPGHFNQWFHYRILPVRDHALKREEDRAEREEAGNPYGRGTVPVFVLMLLIGIGIALLVWGWDDVFSGGDE